MTAWTPETRAAEIARQLSLIEDAPVAQAVVDYGLNWRKTGVNARFGTRDLRHVAIYKLTVVALNTAAKAS